MGCRSSKCGLEPEGYHDMGIQDGKGKLPIHVNARRKIPPRIPENLTSNSRNTGMKNISPIISGEVRRGNCKQLIRKAQITASLCQNRCQYGNSLSRDFRRNARKRYSPRSNISKNPECYRSDTRKKPEYPTKNGLLDSTSSYRACRKGKTRCANTCSEPNTQYRAKPCGQSPERLPARTPSTAPWLSPRKTLLAIGGRTSSYPFPEKASWSYGGRLNGRIVSRNNELARRNALPDLISEGYGVKYPSN